MRSDIQYIDTVVYAGRIKNREELMKSSSGGAFTVLSDVFIKRGDAVACSIYNYKTHMQEYKLIFTVEERDAARGSKYTQSKPGNIYNECVAWLRANPKKNLLFVGMGCQADGFRRYIETIGLRERVFIVDIICHGSPSPKIWREYIQLLEKKFNGSVSNLTFKDKRNGWKKPTAVAVINDEEVSLKEYVRIFYNCCALRPSCHRCPYAATERKVDITIGDYWHIEDTIPDFYDSMGNSLFLIHTDKGLNLFEEIKDSIEYRLSNTKECWQKNLEEPTPVSKYRNLFWKDYNKHGIDYIRKNYGSSSFTAKLKNKARKLIYKIWEK